MNISNLSGYILEIFFINEKYVIRLQTGTTNFVTIPKL